MLERACKSSVPEVERPPMDDDELLLPALLKVAPKYLNYPVYCTVYQPSTFQPISIS